MTSEVQLWGAHWFRRDLRIPGNEALKTNCKRNQGLTLGLFFFDSKFLLRPDFSHNRFSFFINTLRALKEDLAQQVRDKADVLEIHTLITSGTSLQLWARAVFSFTKFQCQCS